MTELLTAIPFDRLAPEHHALVGGKCASLGTMSQAGLPVPPGFAVTTQVFVDAKHASGLVSHINQLIDDADVRDAASLASDVRRPVCPVRSRGPAGRGPLVGHRRGLPGRLVRR
jgi:hypothetical protein